MIDDTSLEFDMFEDARQRLVEILVGQGRGRLEAEKIALYVIQGLREMPRLITMLSESRSHAPANILEALYLVLDNASALERAREILLGLDQQSAD
jgi:glycerol-3-phosphate dehydrogenase